MSFMTVFDFVEIKTEKKEIHMFGSNIAKIFFLYELRDLTSYYCKTKTYTRRLLNVKLLSSFCSSLTMGR